MKKKFSPITGITLIEILIGVVISSIMMGAMYTAYAVVNGSYSQITDRAKISQTGRDVVGMIMKDIQMAGYKYFGDSIQHDATHHTPLVITKRSNSNPPTECDQVDIVYGDILYDATQPVGSRKTYVRYKVTYFCLPSTIIDKTVPGGKTPIQAFAVYKSKLIWDNSTNPGSWAVPRVADKTYQDQKIVEYVSDLIFNPIDEEGLIISPPPSQTANTHLLYKIKSVDIGLTMRSKNFFYKNADTRPAHSLSDAARTINKNDRYLRDTITVSAYTRNLGLE